MLSGAFILPQKSNAEYGYFYRKSLRGVGIQTVIFSILYFLYSMSRAAAALLWKDNDASRLLSPVKDLIKGAPFYHMWYLYMLIGVYLLAPLAIRFRATVTERAYNWTVWLFLLAATGSMWTSKYLFNWDIGQSFCYLGYFMAGERLRTFARERKNNGKGLCLIAVGAAIELAIACIQYRHGLAGITEEKYTLVGASNPAIVLASLLIFTGFAMLSLQKDLGALSRYTFLIYLLHGGVWDVLRQLLKAVGSAYDSRIVIPVSIVATFALSYILSVLYQRIWRAADGKWHVTDRLCRAVHLA